MKNQSTNLILINSFILSTISFIIGNIILKILNYSQFLDFHITEVVEILSGSEREISLHSFITAIIISFVLMIYLIRLLSYNKIFKLLNKLGITKNRQSDNICRDFLFDNSWIVFRDFEKKLYYYGQIYTIINDDDLLRTQIVLVNVIVYSDADGTELTSLKELYLSRNHNEFTIETLALNERGD